MPAQMNGRLVGASAPETKHEAPTAPSSTYSKQENAEIERRLEALGYLG